MTMTLDGKSLIISLYNPDEAAFGRTIQVGITSGLLEREWQTFGSPQATCPQWVEIGGQLVLVITTAVEHMASDRRVGAPSAGCLYRCLTGMLPKSTVLRNFLPVFDEPI
jgi:hypothetical protein